MCFSCPESRGIREARWICQGIYISCSSGKLAYWIALQVTPVIAAIEQAGVPALRGAFTLAALVLVVAGIVIFRRRHQLFDRDPTVVNDEREVRDDRIQLLVLVWGGLTTLIVGILIDVLRA